METKVRSKKSVPSMSKLMTCIIDTQPTGLELPASHFLRQYWILNAYGTWKRSYQKKLLSNFLYLSHFSDYLHMQINAICFTPEERSILLSLQMMDMNPEKLLQLPPKVISSKTHARVLPMLTYWSPQALCHVYSWSRAKGIKQQPVHSCSPWPLQEVNPSRSLSLNLCNLGLVYLLSLLDPHARYTRLSTFLKSHAISC